MPPSPVVLPDSQPALREM